jgi:hypothetical protein
MKALLILITVMVITAPTRAEELKIATCCLRHVVDEQPEIGKLKELARQTGSDKNKELLLKRREQLRLHALEILKEIQEARGYLYVFEASMTRREALVKYNMEGMLVSYSADDITDEVSDILSGKKQINVEQAGTGQPATRPESKSEGSDKPQPEAEGRSR